MPHLCHAAGCTVPVDETKLFCRYHWFMTPKVMRDRIWAAYRVGQCQDMKISHEYACAARAAVRLIGEKERQSPKAINKACRMYDMLDPGPSPGDEVTEGAPHEVGGEGG